MDTNPWPEINPDRKVVRPRGHGLEISEVMSKKIHCAFSYVTSFPLKRIVIQFWRRVVDIGVLSCAGCPYALSSANLRLWKYRSGCVKYLYSIDARGEVGDAMTISGAPLSRVAIEYFPEVVLDLRAHRGTPLVDLALECELTCYVMLPVFHESRFVGVIEVSMSHPAAFAVIFYELKCGLKRAGLSISPPLSFVSPNKAITGLEPALIEIKNALQVAVQSHGVTLCLAWLSYESRSRDLLVKSYCVGDHVSVVKGYYQDLLALPFKKGQGLVGRTLETHRPHLCRNIYKLSHNRGGLLALLSADANANYACFVICLRSSHTGQLDHVFEFFWPKSHSHLALMEALLLTLSKYLPSFKYATGAQLGDESLVVDVDNSSSGGGSVSTPIKIFQGNKTSKTPKQSVGMKRKSVDLYDGQSELNQANQHPLTNINNPQDEDEDEDVIILAVYKVDHRLFFIPSSYTFENVMDKIKQEFEDPAGTYKVDYQVLQENGII